jgi:hypothetical protein
MLHDAAANLEIGHHLKRIHHRSNAPTGRLDQVADFGDERSKITGLRFRDSGSFGDGWFLFQC